MRPVTQRPGRFTSLIVVVTVLVILIGTVSGSVDRAPVSTGASTPGPAATSAGSGLSVVAVGDSVPAGDNCSGCVPYIDLFARQIADKDRVPFRVANLGVGGWTASDLLDALDVNGADVDAVRDADILVVTIGANDFEQQMDSSVDGSCGGADRLACFAPTLRGLQVTLTAVLQRAARLRGDRHTAVLVTGYWDVFPDGDVAVAQFGPQFVANSATLTRRVNAVIAAVAADQGATYIDLFGPFKGADGDRDPTAQLADDGDHPNQAGHRTIADALTRALIGS